MPYRLITSEYLSVRLFAASLLMQVSAMGDPVSVIGVFEICMRVDTPMHKQDSCFKTRCSVWTYPLSNSADLEKRMG